MLGCALEALGLSLGGIEAFGPVGGARFVVNMTLPAAKLAIVIEGAAPVERRHGDAREAAIRADGWTAVRIPQHAIDAPADRWRVAMDIAMRAARAVA